MPVRAQVITAGSETESRGCGNKRQIEQASMQRPAGMERDQMRGVLKPPPHPLSHHITANRAHVEASATG